MGSKGMSSLYCQLSWMWSQNKGQALRPRAEGEEGTLAEAGPWLHMSHLMAIYQISRRNRPRWKPCLQREEVKMPQVARVRKGTQNQVNCVSQRRHTEAKALETFK